MSDAVCIIPNCGKRAPAAEAFCADHRDRPARACRSCVECQGQDHHWNYYGDEDENGEPVASCKHCDATRPIGDDETFD